MFGRMLASHEPRWVLALILSLQLTLLVVGTYAQSRPAENPETRPASQPSTLPAPAAASAEEPLKKPDIDSSIHVKENDRVDIHVAEVPLATVLRVLSTQSRRNIVASAKVRGTVTADLFDVNFLEALDSILRANNCVFEERDRFIYVYTLEEFAALRAEKKEEPFVSKLIRLNYVTVKDIQPLIQPLLSTQGKIAVTPDAKSGLDTSAKEAGGNSLSGPDALMIYDLASNVERIEKLVREIDVRPKQVLIEATILRAELHEENALGIDFAMVDGVNLAMLNSTSPGITDLTTGDLPQGRMGNTNWTLRTDFNSGVPAGGLTFGIIKDHVAAFIRALERVTDTTVLANPKVLALNKQRGQVIVGRRDGYLTTTVTQTTAIQTVEFLETGTQLVFRPFIGDDGYVRMALPPEASTGSLNASNLPYKTTTEVTTNILVRDGHTILIGGLFRENTNTTRSQVPIIGNIPGMGALFRQTTDTSGREEVIILLTVHIIKDDAEYAKIGEELAEEALKIRIGARRGVQWFGRDRLALGYYHQAMQHLKEGRPDKALWETRMSLHISPTYAPAIKLNERFAGPHSCDRQTGAIRDFIRRRIMGADTPEEIGPPSPQSTDTDSPAWSVPISGGRSDREHTTTDRRVAAK